MAPERFTSGQSDTRSDIYALTCVLYECLTSSRPFPGDSVEQQIAGHLTTPPPRPSIKIPGVSPELTRSSPRVWPRTPRSGTERRPRWPALLPRRSPTAADQAGGQTRFGAHRGRCRPLNADAGLRRRRHRKARTTNAAAARREDRAGRGRDAGPPGRGPAQWAPTPAGPVELALAPKPFRRARGCRRWLAPTRAVPVRPVGPESGQSPARLSRQAGPVFYASAFRCPRRRRPASEQGGGPWRGLSRTGFGRPAAGRVGDRRRCRAGHLRRRGVTLFGVLGHTGGDHGVQLGDTSGRLIDGRGGGVVRWPAICCSTLSPGMAGWT